MQLDKLYAKHLYDIAISLAISSHTDKANIMDIYRWVRVCLCLCLCLFLSRRCARALVERALGTTCRDGCYRKYGDYLYDDGNYDGAITQYTATIGFVSLGCCC